MYKDNFSTKPTVTSEVADNNSALFADLYANRLVSQIKNSGDRIDLTFTGEGALAFARALVKYVDEREPRVAQQEEENSLMPKQEVMSKLGVTHATLWNWANKNYLVPVKVGRKVFYHKADIDHLCESKK